MAKTNTLTTPEGKEFKFIIPEGTPKDYRGFYKTNDREFIKANPDIDWEYIAHDLRHRGLNSENDVYERNGETLTSVDFKISLVRSPIDLKSDNWQETAYQWLIFINNVPFDYFTGSGLTYKTKAGYEKPKEPTLEDVLYSLVIDSEACEMSFNEWCANFGYDVDSRKALATYTECQENTDKLAKAGIYANDSLKKYFEDY